MQPAHKRKPSSHSILKKEKAPGYIEMESWKPVSNFVGLYEVSNRGNIRSLKCNRVRPMKKTKNSNNYEKICLMKNKIKHTLSVHRLVGMAFLVPVEGKTTIDHIDQNPSNNNLGNLRWADQTDQGINRKQYSNTGEKNISQSINTGQFHVVIRRYRTILLNVAFSTIEDAIKGRDEFLLSLEMP
jgi:hypothetical protein